MFAFLKLNSQIGGERCNTKNILVLLLTMGDTRGLTLKLKQRIYKIKICRSLILSDTP